MDFADKRIAIAGYGVEGKSVLRYLRAQGVEDWRIVVADQKEIDKSEEDVSVLTGENVFEELGKYDVVFRSPGIRPDAIKTDGVIWSPTNEFFAKCPAPIIGVTGTKGKGTTCTLIAKMLREAGETVHLVGNIGVPALDSLADISKDDIVVFELSSFQLWDLQKSPQVAVALMVEPDHLDVHKDVKEYVAAKAVITSHQTEKDTLIYHPESELTKDVIKGSVAQKLPFLKAPGAEIIDGEIVIDEQKICTVNEVGLVGEHNLENVCAAVTVAWQYTKQIAAIEKVLRDFKGLPHRLEFVRELKGVSYYNDTNASVAKAVAAGLKAFADSPRVLIFGGYDKGVDVSSALDELNDSDHVVLIGQTADNYEAKLKKKGIKYTNLGLDHDMEQIVQKCQKIAKSGSVVLLSPGHPSFDMFDNLYQRGNQFRDAVNNLSS